MGPVEVDGVGPQPLAAYRTRASGEPGLVIGFANTPPAGMPAAVAALAAAIREAGATRA